jgi:ABC-2 type transport system ATP-binding protein
LSPPIPSGNPVLQTQALTRRFGDLVAVEGVTLEVQSAQIFGLLGSNGDKTTMIKMLTTLLPPSAGTATVAGFDIQRRASRVRRMIEYVPQMLSADGNLTGYENLLIFAKLYDVPRRERPARGRPSFIPRTRWRKQTRSVTRLRSCNAARSRLRARHQC